MEVGRERVRAAAVVVEREHAHAPGLAVAADGEQRGRRARPRLPQSPGDRVELAGRPVAEEREGDVQLLWPEDPYPRRVRERPVLPGDELVHGWRRQPERAEQAYP